jgi:hypothetical protein
VDLRQLEYVVGVIDHGGFTRAAEALHVAQPTLSQGIRTLEAELSVELFERVGRWPRRTSPGRPRPRSSPCAPATSPLSRCLRSWSSRSCRGWGHSGLPIRA